MRPLEIFVSSVRPAIRFGLARPALLQHLTNAHPKAKTIRKQMRWFVVYNRFESQLVERESYYVQLGDESAGTEDEVNGNFTNEEKDTSMQIIDISEHLKNPWTSDK